MDVEIGHQQKNERSRTKWTAALDKVFADLIVEQIHQGNRPNHIFDKNTWKIIRNEFNRRTDLNFNNNQLRKHLDVLRTRFCNINSSDQNEFTIDDTCVGFDLWEDLGAQAQARPETMKAKDCPIYEQLRIIFMDSAAEGKYAQSSHYEDLNKSGSNDAGASTPGSEDGAPHMLNSDVPQASQGRPPPEETTEKVNMKRKKKKQRPDMHAFSDQIRRDRKALHVMARVMSDMIADSRLTTSPMCQTEDFYSIANCIKALDEITGIDDRTYFSALDLFEEPSLRVTFISLRDHKSRLAWLLGKCGYMIPGEGLIDFNSLFSV